MADEPSNATQNPTTGDTPAPAAAAVETPAAPVAPDAPAAPEVPDFAGQSDEQVTEVAESAAAEASEIVNSDDEFTDEREQAVTAALARRDAAQAELTRRAERMGRLATLRTQSSGFTPARVERPAPAAAPRVADIAKPAGLPQVPAASSSSPAFRLVVPTDAHNLVNDRPQGSEFGNFSELGVAMERRISSYGSVGKGRSVSHGLAVIERNYGSEFTVRNEDSDDAVIAHARREQNLAGGSVVKAWQKNVQNGGSLTAAAGWCAPSETLYDLCEMESLDGLIELPEVVATRGGVRYTNDIAFPDLWAADNTTTLTEAQVIAGGAGAQKACAPIPCPAFVDTRLNVTATCVTGSFMQLRGYPELVARYIRGTLVKHAHKRNQEIIESIVAKAGAVTPIVTPATDAATPALLKAVELAAEDIRYRYRLSFNTSLEVVLPHWIIPILRDDFTRRTFTQDPAVNDAQIMSWFAARNVRPQFVYDWQDFYSTTTITMPGGVPATNPPYNASLIPANTAVDFLIYPAGSVVVAAQDVITLRNVYDSTNLGQNQYTDLFTEEGWAPIYPCQGLRLYSAITCASGATGSPADWSCVAA